MRTHLGFVSYSTKDKALVWPIRRKVLSLSIPKHIPLPVDPVWVKRRFSSLFLDRQNLPFGSEKYMQNVRTALEQSEWLLVFCSPDSAQSDVVQFEIQHFLEHQPLGFQRVLPIILEGDPWASDEEAQRCLPPALYDHWADIRDWNLPTRKGIFETPRKYHDALSKMVAHTLGGSEAGSTKGATWRDHLTQYFVDRLIRPREVLVHGYAVQIGAYLLGVAAADLHNALREEEKQSFRVRVAVAFATVLAMFGLVQWAMYERQIAGTQTAHNMQNAAEQALRIGNTSEALAYLGRGLRSKPLPVAQQMLQKLLLQESWLVPMPPQPGTIPSTDRSGLDAQLYTMATTKFKWPSSGVDDDPQTLPVALTPANDKVVWTMPGTLQLVRQDGNVSVMYEASPQHGVIPLGMMQGDTTYAFAEVPFETALRGLDALNDNTLIHLVDAATGAPKHTLSVTGWLQGLGVGAQSRYLFAAFADSPDKKAWLAAFDPEHPSPVWQTSVQILVHDVRVSPDGALVLLRQPLTTEPNSNENLLLFDAWTGKKILEREFPPLAHIEFSPDGQRLAVVDMQKTLRVLAVQDGLRDVVMPLRLRSQPRGLAFSTDARQLSVISKDSIQWYGLQTTTSLAENVSIRELGAIPAILSLPYDEALLVVQQGMSGSTLEIRDLQGKRLSNVLSYRDRHETSALSSDGRLLAIVGELNPQAVLLVRIERRQDADVPYLLQQEAVLRVTDKAQCLAFQPAGSQLLVSAMASTAPGVVHVFDTQQPEAPPRLVQQTGPVSGLTYLADGKQFAVRSDGSLHTLNATTLEQTSVPWDALSVPDKVAHNPDGVGMVTTTWQTAHYYSRSKRLWEKTLPMRCSAIAFSADGALMAMALNKREIFLVDCATGKTLGQSIFTDYPIEAMAFAQSQTDRMLLVSLRSSTVEQWEQGQLLLYSLGEVIFQWKSLPMKSLIRGFLSSSKGEVLPWNMEGFFRIPGIYLLGQNEPMVADVAETLGGWQLDAQNQMQPASRSLLMPAEQLASSPGWRTCLQWLQTPASQRTWTPGSLRLLKSELDARSQKDTYGELQSALAIDPGHAGALARIWWQGALAIGAATASAPPSASQKTKALPPQHTEATRSDWNTRLQTGGLREVYSIAKALSYADFWSGRSLALHADTLENRIARITFLRQIQHNEEAQTLLETALQHAPDHPELLKEQALLESSKGAVSSAEASHLAQRNQLREQIPLDGDELVRASSKLYRLRVQKNGDANGEAAADFVQDIVRGCSQSSLSTLKSRRTSEFIFDFLYELWNWPTALESGSKVLENVLAQLQAGAMPGFKEELRPDLQRLLALYALLRKNPQQAQMLLTTLDEQAFPEFGAFFLLSAVLNEVLPHQGGQPMLLERLEPVLELPENVSQLDALTLLYALQRRGAPISPDMTRAMRLLENRLEPLLRCGIVRVDDVAPDGSGAKAGIVQDDRIQRYGDIPVLSAEAFIGERLLQAPGETRQATLCRNGNTLIVDLPSGKLQVALSDDVQPETP